MQVVMNPKKKFGADPFCHFRDKHKNSDALHFRKNNVTGPKARRL